MHRKILFVFFALLETFKLSNCLLNDNWGYGGKEGPKNWCKMGYAECCDNKQSPIDLVTSKMKFVKSPIRFSRLKSKPASIMISDEHSAKIKFLSRNLPILTCTTRSIDYVLDNIHFHFPSEHTVGGKHFPLEAHLVFRNPKYPSAQAAATSSNGIVVLAIFYKLYDYRNLKLDAIINAMKFVHEPRQKYSLNTSFSAADLLPDLRKEMMYFIYNGSLTTPPCSGVTWIVISTPVAISHNQMQLFFQRHPKPQSGGQFTMSNNRPLQNYNNRPVFISSLKPDDVNE